MNSWQQPVSGEPGGATWHKVENPTVGWFASKTASWVADRFNSTPTDCLTVDFSPVVLVGTRAVRIAWAVSLDSAVASNTYWRPSGDTNISNTPEASTEYANLLEGAASGARESRGQAVVWLSAAYKVDFAVTNTAANLYISYPVGYLL